MSETEAIARRDFQAWTSHDAETVRIVEQLTVRNGKIASTVLVTDPAAFARL